MYQQGGVIDGARCLQHTTDRVSLWIAGVDENCRGLKDRRLLGVLEAARVAMRII